jgi:uncharacterized repeat protein (TIGR04138 family)
MFTDFYRKVEEICGKDPRYKPDAYEFMMQALWFTQKELNRKGHITGKELVEGIRKFGLEQFGPMTKTVFGHWGIRSTQDFGDIVFNMIAAGLLNKTEDDSLEDFKDIYDFDAAFDSKSQFIL